MKKSLKVKIPKKFKAALSKRFTYGKEQECVICENYTCQTCPFRKWIKFKGCSAINWILLVDNEMAYSMSHYDEKEIKFSDKKLLTRFRKRADKLIEWV